MKAILKVSSPCDATKIADVLITNGYDVSIKPIDIYINTITSYRGFEVEVSKDENNWTKSTYEELEK